MHDMIDDLMAEALEDTVAVARLEGTARRLLALWRDRRMGILTPEGRRVMEALEVALAALEARGSTGRGDEDEGEGDRRCSTKATATETAS